MKHNWKYLAKKECIGKIYSYITYKCLNCGLEKKCLNCGLEKNEYGGGNTYYWLHNRSINECSCEIIIMMDVLQ